MSELEELQKAIAALDTQRHLLGDDVVNVALAPMQEKLVALQAQETTADPRLKLVTVLFTDVTGSTQISQSLDPEDMLTVMDGAMQRLGLIIEQYGGRVIKYMGDGLMALFGDSITQENDAEQAVRAGLEILQEALSYGQAVEREWGLGGFNVRVGINTGQVILGGGVEADNSAMGMTINIAQRMESSAPVGGLRISRATYRHVRTAFDLAAQPPIRVKGKDEAVETYLVLGARERRFHSPRAGVEGVNTQLIGREVELTRLQELFFDSVEGSETHIVTLVGEPGVGKSRLLFEFEGWVQSQPQEVAIYKGRSDLHTECVPYGLLHNLFAEHCHILDSDSAAETRQKFEACFVPHFADDARVKSHFIGALLGFDFSNSSHLRGVRDNPAQLREQANYYLLQYFLKVAQQGPTLLFLEDIHWADGPSLDFIQRLNRESPHLRLMVLSLTRETLFERRPQWGSGQSTDEATNSRIYLKPLSRRACSQLINEYLKKVQEVPPALRDLIVTNSEGNPFYAEEIINILIDDGIIVRDENNINWRIVTDKVDDVRVPPTLTAVLEARLDNLPPGEKLTLQQAAVVGRVFWDAILDILHEGKEPVADQLESLYERELIYPWPTTAFSGANEYLFKHILLRDVAYDTVLKRARRTYHQLIADWLVETCQRNDRTDEYPAAIGEHYALAGLGELAAGWFLQAGEKAHAQGAPEEARAFLDRTLQLLPESDKERRWRALLVKDEVLGILGETEARELCLNELLALAKEAMNDDWLAHAYYRQASHATSTGEERSALQHHALALESVQKTSNQKLEALILGMMLTSQTRLGDLALAASTVEETLAAAEKLGDDETLAMTRTNVAFYYAEIGDIVRATKILEQQVALCQKMENMFGETIGRVNLGYNYAHLGLYSLSCSVLEKALTLSANIGARRLNAFARYNLALAYWREGLFDQATPLVTGALQDLVGIGDAFGVAAGLSYHALILESTGDKEGAIEKFTGARIRFEELGTRAYANDALAGIIRCLPVQEKLEPAREQLGQLWDYLVNNGSEGMEFPVFAYQTCATAFNRLGEPARAHQSTKAGYAVLMEQAIKISDPTWRNSFLINVPEHRTLGKMWNRLPGNT